MHSAVHHKKQLDAPTGEAVRAADSDVHFGHTRIAIHHFPVDLKPIPLVAIVRRLPDSLLPRRHDPRVHPGISGLVISA